jgi:hypothetical protein
MAEADHEHDWQLVEVNFSEKGADRELHCSRCPAVTYQPAQAALRDDRPPL